MKLKNFFDLTIFMTATNLKKEITTYYLNYLWWIFEPLFDMVILYFVFSRMLGHGGDNYIVFLLVGITFWLWFPKCVNNSSLSIRNEKALIQQVYVPKVFFPLVSVLQNSVKQLVVVFLLMVFLWLYGIPVTYKWFLLPLIMIIQLALIFGCSFLCAAVVPFFPDLQFVIGIFIQIMFFVSGIIFSIESVILPAHVPLVYLNPIAGLIKNYRIILMEGKWPEWDYLFYVLLFSIVLIVFSVWLLRRFDHVYPRVLCE